VLAFCRALDHLGFDPRQLDWVSLRQLYERAADIAELLYGVERGHITTQTAITYRTELDTIAAECQRLQSKVRAALPAAFQKRLDSAIPIAGSTITHDDIYAAIRDAP